LIATAEAMGEQPNAAFAFGTFTRALRLAELRDGRIIFRSEDDPAVTGVSFEKMTETAGG
jgi:hypothetical protein